MPYADNNGVRIHYHVEGEGTPLVLQHGLTSSILRWFSFGFVDALKNDFRLLIIDARGHGDSDKLYDAEAYDRKAMASDVVAVLDAESIDRSHYMGYSMGGSIGFGIAESFADRFHSLIIGGMHPYPLDAVGLDSRVKRIKSGGMEGYVADMESGGEAISPERKAQLLANDPQAIIGASLGLKNRPDLSHSAYYDYALSGVRGRRRWPARWRRRVCEAHAQRDVGFPAGLRPQPSDGTQPSRAAPRSEVPDESQPKP